MLTPGVRAAQVDGRVRDRRHANLIVGAREEGGESRGERLLAQDAEADGRAEELLLGDEHLEEAVGMGLLEFVGVGRVGHLGVQRDDVRPAGAQRRQGVAVGLARRLLAADRVGRAA